MQHLVSSQPQLSRYVEALGRELTDEEIRTLKWRPKADRLVAVFKLHSKITATEAVIEAGIDTTDADDMRRVYSMLIAWGRA